MGSDDKPDVAVVGAAGFVGRELLRRLETLGIKVAAVVRGSPELSVDGDFHVAFSQPNLSEHRFKVVINLAYPAGGPRHEHADLTTAIADTVGALVRDGGRVIQVSTLAVFGGTLDRPVIAGPVSEVRDVTYVESKIAAENLFAKQQAERRLSLDIVRLGNVWGYASGAWALPVVQRLLTGRPVGVRGAPGYSNTTDVANVADYLAFLVQADDDSVGIRYHHLAEFSNVKWIDWVDPIAEAMQVSPVYIDSSLIVSPTSGFQEVTEVLTPMQPRRVYRQLADGRVTGSWTRTLVRRLPATVRSRLQSSDLVRAVDPEPDPTEQDFMAILAGQREFASVVNPGWSPLLAKEQSLERVLQWLERG